MGLPVARLLVATNVNDILHRALSAGDYSVGTVTPTVAPSMDIQVSSNFERLLFDLHGRDGAALEAAMQSFEPAQTLAITEAQRVEAAHRFSSASIDEDAMAMGMRWASAEAGQVRIGRTNAGNPR